RARHQPGRVPGYRKADERVPQRARVEGAYVLLGRKVLPGDRHGTQPARQVHRQRLAAREAEAGAVPGEAGERKPLVGGFWTEPPREGYNRSGGFFLWRRAGVAQEAEQGECNPQVVGSSPIPSSRSCLTGSACDDTMIFALPVRARNK